MGNVKRKQWKYLKAEEYDRIKNLQALNVSRREATRITGRSINTVARIYKSLNHDDYLTFRRRENAKNREIGSVKTMLKLSQETLDVAQSEMPLEDKYTFVNNHLDAILRVLEVQNKILENIEINTRKRGIF